MIEDAVKPMRNRRRERARPMEPGWTTLDFQLADFGKRFGQPDRALEIGGERLVELDPLITAEEEPGEAKAPDRRRLAKNRQIFVPRLSPKFRRHLAHATALGTGAVRMAAYSRSSARSSALETKLTHSSAPMVPERRRSYPSSVIDLPFWSASQCRRAPS